MKQIENSIASRDRVMVVLDVDHRKEHLLHELRIYSEFVTKGSYLIVEDTSINGNPAIPDFGPGPIEAVDQLLKERHDLRMETEKFYLTFNPNGYLLKVK